MHGRIAPDVVQKIVRSDYPQMKLCDERGLRRDAKLHGKVTTRFTVETDGAVSSAKEYGDTPFPDAEVTTCVVARFAQLELPQPDGGTVDVVYPIIFNPTD